MIITNLHEHNRRPDHQRYGIIYADPPWSFNNKKTGGSMSSGASQKYSDMSVAELCALPVPAIAADNCVLLMWWVASMPAEALFIVEDWGFELKTMTAFVWNKMTVGGKRHFGMGFWTRAGSECCLLATKGNPIPLSHSVRSVTTAQVLKHSKKPDIFADKTVELCGDIPRIELFARDEKNGWDCFGNEVCDQKRERAKNETTIQMRGV